MRRWTQKEIAVCDWFAERDWFATRVWRSLGPADVVALKDGEPPVLCQVKGDARGPYENFRPADRLALIFAAELAGATATLAWWPPEGKLRFIGSSEWPGGP